MDCKKSDGEKKLKKPWPKNQFEQQSKLTYQTEFGYSLESSKTKINLEKSTVSLKL